MTKTPAGTTPRKARQPIGWRNYAEMIQLAAFLNPQG
jgi:hypothetical protein